MTDRSSQAPCALIVMGVSGSGKSTIAAALAKRLGWSYEDGDRFHPANNVTKMSAGQPLTDEDRLPWLRAIASEIDRVAAAKTHIVIACSALKRVYRDILVHGRPDTRIVYLQGSRELIAARLAARKNHFMPPGLLDSQFAALEEPRADENPVIVGIGASVDTIVNEVVGRLALPDEAQIQHRMSRP